MPASTRSSDYSVVVPNGRLRRTPAADLPCAAGWSCPEPAIAARPARPEDRDLQQSCAAARLCVGYPIRENTMQAGSPGRVERRLAAILAADVVGYSRLMEADEAGTARMLREHRATAGPLVAEHGGGGVKKTRGGGLGGVSPGVWGVGSGGARPKTGGGGEGQGFPPS